MIDWFVVLAPLLILPIFVLMRFIGCDPFTAAPTPPTPPPTYESQVLADTGLLAYWRLGEPAPPAPPAPDPAKAKDEKGFNDGDYITVAPNQAQSALSQGGLSGKADRGAPSSSLLRTETSSMSVDFEGGYVRVPNFGTVMLPHPSFTLEAWVRPKTWQAGTAGTPFAHSVVTLQEIDSAGSIPPRGIALFAQWTEGSLLPPGKSPGYYWSTSIGPGTGTDFPRATIWDKQVVPNRRTYLAVTYDATKSTDQLTLHLGMGGSSSHAGAWGARATPSFTSALSNRLYIGASNLQVPPTENIYGPFIGNIQEVAVYNYVVPFDVLAARAMSNLEPIV